MDAYETILEKVKTVEFMSGESVRRIYVEDELFSELCRDSRLSQLWGRLDFPNPHNITVILDNEIPVGQAEFFDCMDRSLGRYDIDFVHKVVTKYDCNCSGYDLLHWGCKCGAVRPRKK